MFTKIVVALNDLPESQHALRTAIELARAYNAELATVSILGDLPAYTSFAVVVDPNAPNAMKEDQRRAHSELHEKASTIGPGAWSSRERLDRRGAGGTADTSFPKRGTSRSGCYWPSSARLLFIPSLEFRL
jgi:nucleotide-binding universal stress UspA family protein